MAGAPDYFAPPAVQPPQLPSPAALALRAPRRRRLLLAVLLLVLPAGALAVTAGRPEPVAPLRWVEAPADSGWSASYVDLSGRPARWDPCTPIRYVVQPGWIPDQGRRDLAGALRRLSAASGLEFEDAGDTDELPARTRAAYQPERYGERWAPLLIAWVPPGSTDLGVGAGVQGVSLAVAVPSERGGHLVSGQVVLDAANRLASRLRPRYHRGRGPAARARARRRAGARPRCHPGDVRADDQQREPVRRRRPRWARRGRRGRRMPSCAAPGCRRFGLAARPTIGR